MLEEQKEEESKRSLDRFFVFLSYLCVGIGFIFAIGVASMNYAFSNMGKEDKINPILGILAWTAGLFASYPFLPIINWINPPITDNQVVFAAFALNGAFWTSIILFSLAFLKKRRARN